MHTFSNYKGHPTITLQVDENDRFPFSFGLVKAQLIVLHYQAIKDFVEFEMAKRQALDEGAKAVLAQRAANVTVIK